MELVTRYKIPDSDLFKKCKQKGFHYLINTGTSDTFAILLNLIIEFLEHPHVLKSSQLLITNLFPYLKTSPTLSSFLQNTRNFSRKTEILEGIHFETLIKELYSASQKMFPKTRLETKDFFKISEKFNCRILILAENDSEMLINNFRLSCPAAVNLKCVKIDSDISFVILIKEDFVHVCSKSNRLEKKNEKIFRSDQQLVRLVSRVKSFETVKQTLNELVHKIDQKSKNLLLDLARKEKQIKRRRSQSVEVNNEPKALPLTEQYSDAKIRDTGEKPVGRKETGPPPCVPEIPIVNNTDRMLQIRKGFKAPVGQYPVMKIPPFVPKIQDLNLERPAYRAVIKNKQIGVSSLINPSGPIKGKVLSGQVDKQKSPLPANDPSQVDFAKQVNPAPNIKISEKYPLSTENLFPIDSENHNETLIVSDRSFRASNLLDEDALVPMGSEYPMQQLEPVVKNTEENPSDNRSQIEPNGQTVLVIPENPFSTAEPNKNDSESVYSKELIHPPLFQIKVLNNDEKLSRITEYVKKVKSADCLNENPPERKSFFGLPPPSLLPKNSKEEKSKEEKKLLIERSEKIEEKSKEEKKLSIEKSEKIEEKTKEIKQGMLPKPVNSSPLSPPILTKPLSPLQPDPSSLSKPVPVLGTKPAYSKPEFNHPMANLTPTPILYPNPSDDKPSVFKVPDTPNPIQSVSNFGNSVPIDLPRPPVTQPTPYLPVSLFLDGSTISKINSNSVKASKPSETKPQVTESQSVNSGLLDPVPDIPLISPYNPLISPGINKDKKPESLQDPELRMSYAELPERKSEINTIEDLECELLQAPTGFTPNVLLKSELISKPPSITVPKAASNTVQVTFLKKSTNDPMNLSGGPELTQPTQSKPVILSLAPPVNLTKPSIFDPPVKGSEQSVKNFQDLSLRSPPNLLKTIYNEEQKISGFDPQIPPPVLLKKDVQIENDKKLSDLKPLTGPDNFPVQQPPQPNKGFPPKGENQSSGIVHQTEVNENKQFPEKSSQKLISADSLPEQEEDDLIRTVSSIDIPEEYLTIERALKDPESQNIINTNKHKFEDLRRSASKVFKKSSESMPNGKGHLDLPEEEKNGVSGVKKNLLNGIQLEKHVPDILVPEIDENNKKRNQSEGLQDDICTICLTDGFNMSVKLSCSCLNCEQCLFLSFHIKACTKCNRKLNQDEILILEIIFN